MAIIQAVGEKISAFSKSKKPRSPTLDDQTIENMVRYYRIDGDYGPLLRYVKSKSIRADDQQLV